MAGDRHTDQPDDAAPNGRPHFVPSTNGQQGPDDAESVIANNDIGMRGAGAAGESAGAGVPGLGGAPGGTPNGGGLGLPGGNQRLASGRAPSADAGLGGNPATGGLGTGGNPQSGLGQTPATDVLPGGATRSTKMRGGPDDVASPWTPEHPVPEEPAPRVLEGPGPEAET